MMPWPMRTDMNEIWRFVRSDRRGAFAGRHEGKCHVCHRQTLITYKLPADRFDDGNLEGCGYYCGYCGWSAAGARRKSICCDVLVIETRRLK